MVSRYHIDTYRYNAMVQNLSMSVNVWDTISMKAQLPVHCCTPATVNVPHLESDNAETHARLLKAVAEPMRLRILSLIASLGGEDVCACEFPGVLGISQPTASHHLKVLTEAGYLTRVQRGKWAHYTLVPETFAQARSLLDIGTIQASAP